MDKKILSLRMERQCFLKKADEDEYIELYRDTQPGQNVYWNGFGQPPTLSFRAGFDDLEFNRERQFSRKLVKGRFAGGNLGWIEPRNWEYVRARSLARALSLRSGSKALCFGRKRFGGLRSSESVRNCHTHSTAFGGRFRFACVPMPYDY